MVEENDNDEIPNQILIFSESYPVEQDVGGERCEVQGDVNDPN